MSCLLSVIIISHNQKELFRRCIDSVLAQDLPFEHEIIVSDDASTDGTWELILEYQDRYPEIVKAYQCNSDDCNPANNSHRSGWNRCNAYPHATGKYIAHVDADDYFRPGADVYKRQVEALEQHPECSLAFSNVYKVHEGEELTDDRKWHRDWEINDGRIISGKDYIAERLFILNQAFVLRRNPSSDPVQLYGKRYVDAVITFHHLQYGPIIYVDACDYVYVHQEKSVTDEMCKTRDTEVLWCLGLYIPALIPMWRHDYYLAEYSSIRNVIKLARSGYRLQEKNKNSLNGLGVFLFDSFNKELRLFDKLRLFVAELYIRTMHKLHLTNELSTRILSLLISKRLKRSHA